MTNARPTLATVAAELGVSRMTVRTRSTVPDQLSPELRERVLAKARELGYGGPEPGARTLSRGKTGSIGVILDAPLTLAFSDPAAVQTDGGRRERLRRARLGMALVPRITGRTRSSCAARSWTASSSTAWATTTRGWTRCSNAACRTR